MFEFAEVSFDQIALAIDVAVDGSLDFAVALCGDVSDSAHCLDLLDEGAGIVAAVSDHVADAFQAGDQPRGDDFIRCLALRQRQPDRQTCVIDDDVDFRAQSPARETDGVIRTPFFPPAACWWARMTELSIKVMDSGDCSASRLKISTQTPAFAHRLKRL